jgi:hypothetical protein
MEDSRDCRWESLASRSKITSEFLQTPIDVLESLDYLAHVISPGNCNARLEPSAPRLGRRLVNTANLRGTVV